MFENQNVIRGLGRLSISVLIAMVALFSVEAKEVTISHQGLILNGELMLAQEKPIEEGVLLLTHGTLAHNRMEIITGLQELLAESGVSTLAINLSLGVDNRHGSYDCTVPHRHHHTDAVDEMVAWIDWLEQQGVKQIDVMGHSRGGNQVAWLMAEKDRSTLRKGVLLAPATWSEEKMNSGYKKRYNEALNGLYAKAEAQVAAGQGESLMEHTGFIYCADASATASAFVSYYGSDIRRHTPNLLKRIGKPVLVVAGSEDSVVGPLALDVEPLSGEQIQFILIDGADHFFLDLYLEEVAEEVVEWLQQ